MTHAHFPFSGVLAELTQQAYGRKKKRPQRRQTNSIEALEERRLLSNSATISNFIIGDGGLTLTVDAYGSYGAAYVSADPNTQATDTLYDPFGGGTNVFRTTQSSALYVGGIANQFLTSNTLLDPNALTSTSVANAAPDSAVSDFTLASGSLDVHLIQTILALDSKNRTVLDQAYTFTNNTGSPVALPLVRYVNAGMFQSGSITDDAGGVSGDGAIVFVFDTRTGGGSYQAILAAADDPTALAATGYTLQKGVNTLPASIYGAGGIPGGITGLVGADLDIATGGFDANGDRLTDAPVGMGATAGPWVMALQSTLTVPAGGSETYHTFTRFGSGVPLTVLRTGTFVLTVAPTVNEGDGGNNTTDTLLPFTVTRTNGDLGATSIDVKTFKGSAVDGTSSPIPPDFVAYLHTFNFADEETTANDSVTVINDQTIEQTENFSLGIGNGTFGATPTGLVFQAQTIDILDDDGLGQFQLELGTQTVSENVGTVPVRISRTNGFSGLVTFSYVFNQGGADTALLGSDYTDDPNFSGQVTFNIGEDEKVINIPIVDDLVQENTEVFTISLQSALAGVLIGTTTETITIVDNDLSGQARFPSANLRVSEGAGVAQVEVDRVGPTAGQLDVDYIITAGTATDGQDYIASSGTLTFLAGETQKFIPISLVEDSTSEADETLFIQLATALSANLGSPNRLTFTILDNDTPATFQFASATDSVAENAGSKTVTVRRTGNLSGSVTVDYATTGGTATAGSDFTAVNGTLTFADLQSTATFSVPIIDDTLIEPAETILLALSNPQAGFGVVGTISTETLTIADNDAAVQFSSPTYTVARNAGAITLTVVRTGDLVNAASVAYSTANGTGAAGTDFTAASGILSFAAGESKKTITVTILDDPAKQEPTVNFTVNLNTLSGTGAAFGTNQSAVVTIAGGPQVTGVSLLTARGRVDRIERVVLQFGAALNAASANLVGNYILAQRNAKDGRYNIPVRLSDAVYDPVNKTVTLFPRTVLKANQLYQLSLNSLGSLTDAIGAGVVQGTPGDMGGSFIALFGRGNHFDYTTRQGDNATLQLKRGTMQFLSGFNDSDPNINILDKAAGSSVLTGKVKRKRGNGRTTISSITGISGVRNALPAPTFTVNSAS